MIQKGLDRQVDYIMSKINKKNLFKASSKMQNALGRIAVIADGAHALGASYKGKMVGSIADFTAFSFHATKNFTTAEGGAICWNHIDGIEDKEIYKQVLADVGLEVDKILPDSEKAAPAQVQVHEEEKQMVAAGDDDLDAMLKSLQK